MSGSAGQPRRLAILALLAAAGPQGLTRDKVMAYLWPETDEDRARRSLNQAIYALRQDLGSEDVLLGSRDLRLNPERLSSDLAEFEQALAEGRHEQAASLYTGPFLDGFHLPGAPELEAWVEEERAGLARRFADLLAQLGRRAEEQGDYDAAVRWWRKLAAQDPVNGRVAKGLMQALVAAGDRAGAVQHARIYEALIEQELDLPPDRDVVAFAEELKRAETVRPAPKPPAPSIPGPPPLPDSTPAGPAARRVPRGSMVAVAALLGLALVSGIALLRREAPPSLVAGRTRRVAFGDALELHPAISPDGKMVAYAAQAGDRVVIYVHQIPDGRAVQVSEALPGSHWLPHWSPDASRIAFQAEGLIYEVPAFGGVPRVLVRPSRSDGWVASPAWSPDGATLAYVEDGAIRVRATAGGPARMLPGGPAPHSLAWSPDGKWLAFVSGNPGFVFGESPWGTLTNLGNIAPSAISVVPATGGAPVPITSADWLNTSPVWLPDSRGLLFVSDREGSRDIYRISLARSGAPAGAPVRLTTGLDAHTLGISADGGELVYTVLTSTANIWTVEIPRHGTISTADASRLTEGTQSIEGMSLSPDGRWLAFDSDRGGNQDVYRIPVEGGEPVQLTSSAEDEFVSSWSGNEIAGHSYHAGIRRLQLVPAEGGQPRQVLEAPPNQRSPGLAPDGRAVVFTSDASGELQLYVAHRERNSSWGVARRLTSRGGWAGRWAPDGRTVVYCRQDGVWLMEPAGGAPRRLVGTDGSTARPSPELALWSPDGGTIYFKAFDASGRSSFWSVPAAGGAPRLLMRLDDPTRPSSRPEFATDGKRLFFTIGTRQSDIWAMELRGSRP